MKKVKFTITFLFLYLLVLIIGFISEPSLGDEVYHYRFAKNFYWQGKRPVVDILYQNSIAPEIVYYYDIFWHATLAQIWKVIGQISFIAAQIYQSFYYILLIFLTYLLGKELYDKETGLYAALLVATVPMVAVFSILFYTDVPGAVFSVLCVLLLVKKKYFWAGVALGLMYLSKRNALLFVPAILLISFYQDKVNLKIKIKNLVFLIIGAAIIFSPDLCWREKNLKDFPPNIFTSSKVVLKHLVGASKESSIAKKVEDTNKYKMAPVATVEVGDMKTFTNMLSKDFGFVKYFKRALWLSYFGLATLLGSLFYFICRRHEKKDVILWTLVGSYLLFYFLFLGLSNEIRYTLPIIPFLSILVAIPLTTTKKRLFKNTIIFICLAQFLMATVYLGTKRQVPKEVKDGFTFIKKNTSQDAKLFYVEHLALDRTNRKIKLPIPDDPILKQMFWSPDTVNILGAINQMGLDYIMVKKSRIYDDSSHSYFNGYPKSFVERLPKLPFVKLVFDNKEMSIWEVK